MRLSDIKWHVSVSDEVVQNAITSNKSERGQNTGQHVHNMNERKWKGQSSLVYNGELHECAIRSPIQDFQVTSLWQGL